MSDNIIDQFTSDGDAGVAPDPSTAGLPGANVTDESGIDIDAIFGNPKDELESGKPPVSDPLSFASTEGGKSPEELARQFQSMADKATHEKTILEAQVNEFKGAHDFINELYENKDVFNAFVAEVNPDLVKPQSPEDYIKSNLSKEFGADFVPEEAEQNQPGTKSWLYNRRASDLYGEAVKQGAKIPETIKSLRTKRAEAQKAQQLEAARMKQEIMKDLQWDEAQYNHFANGAQKITPKQFAIMWNYALKKAGKGGGTPNIASVPGGTPVSDNAHMQQLNEMFGAN